MQITMNKPGQRKTKVIADNKGSRNYSSGWSHMTSEPLFDIGLTSYDSDGSPEYYTIHFTRVQALWAMDALKRAMESYDEQAKGN